MTLIMSSELHLYMVSRISWQETLLICQGAEGLFPHHVQQLSLSVMTILISNQCMCWRIFKHQNFIYTIRAPLLMFLDKALDNPSYWMILVFKTLCSSTWTANPNAVFVVDEVQPFWPAFSASILTLMDGRVWVYFLPKVPWITLNI